MTDVEEFLGRVSVDFYDDWLVGDIQVPLDDVSNLPVFLHHIVEYHGVGNDACCAAIHPGLEVLGVAGEPDSRASASAPRLHYWSGHDGLHTVRASLCVGRHGNASGVRSCVGIRFRLLVSV